MVIRTYNARMNILIFWGFRGSHQLYNIKWMLTGVRELYKSSTTLIYIPNRYPLFCYYRNGLFILILSMRILWYAHPLPWASSPYPLHYFTLWSITVVFNPFDSEPTFLFVNKCSRPTSALPAIEGDNTLAASFAYFPVHRCAQNISKKVSIKICSSMGSQVSSINWFSMSVDNLTALQRIIISTVNGYPTHSYLIVIHNL